MSEELTDEQLVRRAQDGSHAAFEMLVRKYQYKIVQLVGRLVGEADAPDVAQEAFIKAFRALKGFKGDSAFYTWLYRIGINTAKNHLVARSRRPSNQDIDVADAELYGHMEQMSDVDTPEAVLLSDEIRIKVGEVIAKFGSKEQRERHCPKLASGAYEAGAFALSEPGAGSDPAGMQTQATKTDDGWVLNGQKQWITSGSHAGVMVVWARTDTADERLGHRGISCFLVEQNAEGLEIGKKEDKLGLRASETVPLTFNDVRVSDDALLGELGQGFKIAMMALDGGRIGIASQAIGIGTAAHEAAIGYSKDRKQFKRPIADFQAIQWMIADSDTELEAARLLTLRAAYLKESGAKSFSRQAAHAKVYASEAAWRVCDRALQIHGGYGYVREFPVERHLRDVRVTRIYEGTSEIQRTVIARSLLRG